MVKMKYFLIEKEKDHIPGFKESTFYLIKISNNKKGIEIDCDKLNSMNFDYGQTSFTFIVKN